MADQIVTETTGAKQEDRIAPWTPSDDAWGGLARDIVMWHDCYPNRLTPRTLFKHLDLVGTEVPQWLRDEPEMQHPDHTISKGTRAVIIYRAMLQDCQPATELRDALGRMVSAFPMSYRGEDTERMREEAEALAIARAALAKAEGAANG